jgi:tetratricopeptide (TPR) repeat protein
VEDFLAEGDAHARAGEDEAALNSYKKCLGLVARGANVERAEIYVRIAGIKRRQDKAREAISNYEKALGVVAEHRGALEALVDLYAAVADIRATYAAEEKLLALIGDPQETFARLVAFGARWMDEAKDPVRARVMLDKARALRGDDLGVLDRLRALYEAEGDTERAFALRREMVGLLSDARAKAAALFGMAKDLLRDPTKEDRALALCDEALETDPSFLSPLEVVAKVLADRQEWSELEQAYRRMLERAPRLADGEVRGRVRAELHRMLGLLFREHLVDPESALDAYEEALAEQPDDLAGQLVAAELAMEIDASARAEAHLLAATVLDPRRAATYHDLFRVRTGGGHDEAAYLAASVTVFLGEATPGEKAIYDANRPKGMVSPKSHLPDGAWALLRGPGARVVSAVLEPIADAAVSARLGELEARARLPKLDAAARQDPEKSTISVVRSLSWASHLLGVPAPAVYLSDDPAVALSAVPAREPSALAGGAVLRGRSPNELAFLVGKHLAYYVGSHRLLIHFPSIEELSVCFLAAVSALRPDSPVPPRFADAVTPLVRRIDELLTPAGRAELAEGLELLDAAGGKANLGGWVAAVERSAARAGYLLSGDLSVAATALRADPVGLLSADDKIADLCAFTVTPEYAALREALGIGSA